MERGLKADLRFRLCGGVRCGESAEKAGVSIVLFRGLNVRCRFSLAATGHRVSTSACNMPDADLMARVPYIFASRANPDLEDLAYFHIVRRDYVR